MKSFMRKLFFVLLLAMTLSACASGRKKASEEYGNEILTLLREYRSTPGFRNINIGRTGTSMIKSILQGASVYGKDEEAEMVFAAMEGIDRIIAADYSECTGTDAKRFRERLSEAMQGSEMLMEFKDGSNLMRIYGIPSDDGDAVRDFVLDVTPRGVLVCLFGSIPAEAIAKFLEDR